MMEHWERIGKMQGKEDEKTGNIPMFQSFFKETR